MSWARFDDQYPDHPKIVDVGPLGMALHTAATCYCARYLTDGFVPAAMMARLINLDGINIVNNGISNAVTNAMLTDELTRAGLFDETTGGFFVHDYLDYNPPAAQVKAERERNKARQVAWKAKRRKDTVSDGVNNTVSDGVNNDAPSPSPINTLKKGAKAPLSAGKPPRAPIQFSDPVWDALHGKEPTTPTEPALVDTTWLPADVIDLGTAFLNATKIPPPSDRSTRGYWIKQLRMMRLNDKLTQDDIRRAIRKMRDTGGIIKSPESVRTVAIDMRAANGPVNFAEVY